MSERSHKENFDPTEKARRRFHTTLNILVHMRGIEAPSNVERYHIALDGMNDLAFHSGAQVARAELKALELPMIIEASMPQESSR